MALALRHPRRASRAATRTPLLPLGVAGVSLVGPALDLVAQLQHVDALRWPALAACALAAALQVAALAYRPSAAWLIASALATGTSVILRLGGYPEGPAFALLGLIALGTGGAFRRSGTMPELVGLAHPAEQPAGPAADGASEPTPLPRVPRAA